MPKFTPETALTGHEEGGPCGPAEGILFSDSGGLTQFGAFVEILPPGSRSSIRHWHSDEDEMVYVLEGTVTLHEGDGTATLGAGDAATFKAGAPVGHFLENTGQAEARYLVIGTRAAADTVTYPDKDRILIVDRAADTVGWTDLAGRPSTNPYLD